MLISRHTDSKGKRQWTYGGAKVLDSQGEIIAYVTDDHGMDEDTTNKFFRLLKVRFADCYEIETYGIAFETVPIINGADIGIIEIGAKGEISTWGF